MGRGDPSEIYYINWTATTDAPTPVPEPTESPFNGDYRGHISDTSGGAVPVAPDNRFDLVVRGGAVITINTHGSGCAFGISLKAVLNENGEFSYSGATTEPGVTASVSGRISGNRASGSVQATRDGQPCLNASWSSSR